MPTVTYTEGFDATAFLSLAQRVWPRDYSNERAEAALTRTINLGAWDGETLVGSVRVLTDGYLFATITEILVDPAYRRHGVGRELMQQAVTRTPKGKLVFGAQPDAVAFFERIGCQRTLTSFGYAPAKPER